MKQPVKNKIVPKTTKTTKQKRMAKKRLHQKYGTSKLEDRFAKEFLDRLGYTYVRQYEAKDIGRFYDFAVKLENGAIALLEIDGSYYHGYGLVHEEKSPMQKHNEWVDKVKDEWAAQHGIPLIRIWEHDINKNPKKVMELLERAIGKNEEKRKILENKKKRH